MKQNLIDTISDTLTTGVEELSEFFASFSKKDKLLSARFGHTSRLLRRRNQGLSLSGNKFLTIKQSKTHVMYFGPWIGKNHSLSDTKCHQHCTVKNGFEYDY